MSYKIVRGKRGRYHYQVLSGGKVIAVSAMPGFKTYIDAKAAVTKLKGRNHWSNLSTIYA